MKITHPRERLKLRVPHVKNSSSIRYVLFIAPIHSSSSVLIYFRSAMAASSSGCPPDDPSVQHATDKAEESAEDDDMPGLTAEGSAEDNVPTNMWTQADQQQADDDLHNEYTFDDDGHWQPRNWSDNDPGDPVSDDEEDEFLLRVEAARLKVEAARQDIKDEDYDAPKAVIRDEDNPWAILGMSIPYEHAIVQHPKEVDRAFYSLLKKWHPNKCQHEEKLQKHIENTQLLHSARREILVTDIDENGMPNLCEAQTRRMLKAR